MKITSVSYRRLQTFGSYQNEAIEMTAELHEEDNAETVLANLRGWVDGRLKELAQEREGRSALATATWALQQEEYDLKRRVEQLREQYESVTDWLNKLQIPVPAEWRDTLPF